ncbi:NUDIX hydrolase [Opitutaceae bacterium EW11]|nr:NUDIX hydrolase [Opitutaceae bacterium EW11]
MVRDELTGGREDLVGLLRAHAGQRLDAHEAAMTQATIEFVRAYPNCADRELAIGHLTGSAWIVDRARRKTLLTHHRKLEKWLQLGGHADGDIDLVNVALREAEEESGLTRLALVSPAIFDVDRHWIPERKGEPAHWHYDVRFLIEADPEEPLVTSYESKALAWVELDRIQELSSEESLLRMARKSRNS